ncbi:MAG: tetraacyldisaccharide 4'-kinase [Acidobacteriaceae bacterium]
MTLRGNSLLRLAVSPFVWPLVLLYAAGVRLKNAAHDLGISRARRLAWPVISVGNLSVGGTGKTPMVLLLARLLQERGWFVDVLSRGYGRASNRVAHVSPDGDWRQFGDEPYLMAQQGISVLVGAERFEAGALAEDDGVKDTCHPITRRLHILDDGFQHRRLARSLDIVLLRRRDLEDEMLPLGRLREPLSALERADICVLRAEDADLTARVLRLMRQSDPARVWIVERRTILPASAMLPRPIPSAFAFCAIGDPSGFFHGLLQAGATIQTEITFRDHHVYTQGDIERLKIAARDSRAKCFVTTEKDAVRLSSRLRSQLEQEIPVIVAGLELSLRDEARCMATLESLIAQCLQISGRNVR